MPLWANSLIHKRNPWCSNGVFSSEIYIHKQLLDNVHGVRTFDPEEADFFLRKIILLPVEDEGFFFPQEKGLLFLPLFPCKHKIMFIISYV